MIPFLVGLFTYISVMEYFRGLQLGSVTGSYLDFYLQRYFFEGWLNQGGFFLWMGHHLWYLLILFAWSVVALPLFIRLRTERNRQRLSNLAAFFNRPGAIYLLIIPIIVIELINPFTQVMDDLGPGGMRQGGWHILTYLVLLIYGYILASNSRFEDTIEKHSFPAFLVVFSCCLFGCHPRSNLELSYSCWRTVVTWCTSSSISSDNNLLLEHDHCSHQFWKAEVEFQSQMVEVSESDSNAVLHPSLRSINSRSILCGGTAPGDD
jgi:hypothetical protein